MGTGIDLPDGVRILPLVPHHDQRGRLVELFRQSWLPEGAALQWNLVSSVPNTFRGVHVHPLHTDYLTVAHGRMTIMVKDLRPHSPTRGLSAMLPFDGEAPQAAVIPPGVAHGFYSHDATVHVYGVTEYWDGSDEFGCRWNDPALELAWPFTDPLLSERDILAGSYDEMMAAVAGLGAFA